MTTKCDRWICRLADGGIDWGFYRSIAFFAVFLSFWCIGWESSFRHQSLGVVELLAVLIGNLFMLGLTIVSWQRGVFRTNYAPYHFSRWEDDATFRRHFVMWAIVEMIMLNPIAIGWPIWSAGYGVVWFLN